MFKIILGKQVCEDGAFQLLDENDVDISDKLRVQSIKIEASVKNPVTRCTLVCEIDGAEVGIDPSEVMLVSKDEKAMSEAES